MLEDNEALKKYVALSRSIGVALILIHVFIYFWRFFFALGFSHEIYQFFAERMLAKSPNAFGNTWTLKTIGVLLIALAGYGTYGKKDEKLKEQTVVNNLLIGLILIFFPSVFFDSPNNFYTIPIYLTFVVVGLIFYLMGAMQIRRLIDANNNDIFNKENETFPQMERKVETAYSVNIPYRFFYDKKWRDGWINIVNPFRAVMVIGTPGSGKSFGTLIPAIHQLIKKDFTGYIYDYKYPDLTLEALNALVDYKLTLEERNEDTSRLPTFYAINFDDPYKSHRINPIHYSVLNDMIDANEAGNLIYSGLNNTASQSGGSSEFFKVSATNLLGAVIFYLKSITEYYQNELTELGIAEEREITHEERYKYDFCSVPHLIEFCSLPYELMFPLMMSNSIVRNTVNDFARAYKNEAMEMIEGQIKSATIPLRRLESEKTYWVLTGNDASLKINDKKEPKILCIGNNPEREKIYGAVLSLFNGRILKLVNRPKRQPCMIMIDEFPTISLQGIDNLINTGRGNLIATFLGLQTKHQLIDSYGQNQGIKLIESPGTILVGQTRGDFAKLVSEMIGNINQKKTEFTYSQDTSVAERINLQAAVTVDTVSNLKQGEMVGTVSDDFGARLEYTRVHGHINAGHEDFPTSPKYFDGSGGKDDEKTLPQELFSEFDGLTEQQSKQIITQNYKKIKNDMSEIIYLEMERLNNGDAMMQYYGKEITKGLSENQEYLKNA